MSDLQLLVGATEFDVLKDNFELNLQANWQGTLACDIDLDKAAARITARSEFTLKKDGVPWRGGVITQTPEQGFGGPNLEDIVHHISGVGYETYLTYRYVTEKIPAGTTLKAALQILDDYLPTGVTLDPAQVTGPTLAQDYVFTKTRLDECLKAITAETGYIPRIDADKLFLMLNPSGNAASFDILDTGPTGPGDGTLYQVGDLRVERTLDDNYANRIIGEVRGAGPATDTIGPFVAADAVTDGGYKRFYVKYPASQAIADWWPNELYIDAVKIGPIGRVVDTPQAWDVALAGWNWDMTTRPASLRYTSGSGATYPAGAQVLTTNPNIYTIAYPFYVTGNDLTDQASHPIKEALVSIDEAMTLEAAQAYVDAEALRRAATTERALYTTEQTDLVPGMTQTINVAARAINASCLITECRFYTTPEQPGTELRCDVTAIVGTQEAGNVRTTYKDWLKQGGTGAARTGVTGNLVAPPLKSVQYNKDGAFGGSEFALLDPDRTGDQYGVGPDQSTAAFGVATGTACILALFNKIAGKAKALTFEIANDGTCYIQQDAGKPLNILTYGGNIQMAGLNVSIGGGDGFNAGSHATIGSLVAQTTLFPNVQRKTTSFTLDAAYASGGTPEYVVLLDSSTARTVTLPVTTADSMALGLTDTHVRQVTFINIGTATWALTPASGNIEGLSTIGIASGQRITVQGAVGTGAGWWIAASHGLGFTTPGSDTDVLFNDGGVVGAASGLAWDKIRTQALLTANPNESVLKVTEGTGDSIVTLNGRLVGFAYEYVGGVDTARDAKPAYLFRGSNGLSMGWVTGETPNSAITYAQWQEWALQQDVAQLQGSASGAGNHPGLGVVIDRNAAGSGAASYLALQERDGTYRYIWVEAGKLRIHTAPPTEDNTTVSHTAGTVVGTQS